MSLAETQWFYLCLVCGRFTLLLHPVVAVSPVSNGRVLQFPSSRGRALFRWARRPFTVRDNLPALDLPTRQPPGAPATADRARSGRTYPAVLRGQSPTQTLRSRRPRCLTVRA